MLQEESDLLRQRAVRATRAYRTAVVSAMGAALAAILVIAGFAILLRRYLLARERSTAIIAEQRDLLRTTLHSIGDAVITTDVAGRVTNLNPIAQELTGWRVADAAGEPVENVFHIVDEETRAPAVNPAIRALREGIIVGLANHTVLLSRDGRETAIDDSASPIRDVRGEVAGAVVIFRDISERRAADIALRRIAAELSEADRRKNEFLAMLAHELRNPLAPIRNALQIVRVTGGSGRVAESAVDMMERQVGQMVKLVDDLIDVSRISRGTISLQRHRIDLVSVVEQALQAARPACEAAQHRLRVTLSPQPLYLEGDPTRLTQVIGNLVNNACKFTDGGGQIEVTVGAESGEAVLRVRDNGMGIAPEQVAHIFEMFAQVDTSLERSQSGLGIGLTLVKTLTEMHGGTVDAHSPGIGRGSEFVVRLPLAVETRPNSPPARSAAVASVPRRILVVDDNRDAAESLALLLQLGGHQVQVAYDGAEAVAAAATGRPELILLDIGLPRLNGYEVARHVREEEWGQGVTIVALTGWGQDEDRRRSSAAGFDDHLTKPVEHGALEKLLAKLPG